MPPGRSRLTHLIASAAAAALALAGAGCGSDDAKTPTGVIDISGTDRVGQEIAGSVAPLAQCRDWVKGTREQKLATIADIRSQQNPGDPGIEAPPLTDEEAMGVFNGACSEDFASGFRLYKLYAHAAGFAPLARELDSG